MNSNLQQALYILFDMEINNYMMLQAINKLNCKISQLGYKKKFYDVKKEANDTSITMFVMVVGGIVAIIAAIIMAIIGVSRESSFFGKIGGFLGGIFEGGLYGLMTGAVIGFIYGIISKVKRDKDINLQYQKNIAQQNEAKEADIKRVDSELREIKILEAQKKQLQSKLADSKQKLNKFYKTVGIDSSYRYLIPIGYMHEFIRLGIANKLEGADGLYYLVRQELRMDQIQSTLEEISFKLDQILDRQSELYVKLTQIEKSCNTMVEKATRAAELAVKNNQLLEEAVANTSITAYNSQRIANELSFQNFMLTYIK